MKTSALFILSLFSSLIPATAQPKSDTVEVSCPNMQVDSNYAVISAVVTPNGNSATVYFELDKNRIYGVRSFSGNEGTVSYAFHIPKLQPGTTYELKFTAFSNDDSKKPCGRDKIVFTTKLSEKQKLEMAEEKKRKKNIESADNKKKKRKR